MNNTNTTPSTTPEVPMTEDERIEAAIRAGEEAAQADFKKEVEKLKEERDELLKKISKLEDASPDDSNDSKLKEANDKLMRLQADWENFRRRTAKERLEESKRANERFIVDMLPVLDDIERAIAHVPAPAKTESTEQVGQFAEGIKAVYAKMLDVLGKYGAEPMNALGKAFDPTRHKAVGQVEDSSMYADSVHDVYINGYTLGDKVIREAMVTVSLGGPARPVETEEENNCESDQASTNE